jgi:hypothetical protein
MVRVLQCVAFWGRVSKVRVMTASTFPQRSQPALDKAFPPLAHRLERHAAFGGHGGVAQASGAIQYDPGALGCALVGFGPQRHQFKFGLFLGLQGQGFQGAANAHASF